MLWNCCENENRQGYFYQVWLPFFILGFLVAIFKPKRIKYSRLEHALSIRCRKGCFLPIGGILKSDMSAGVELAAFAIRQKDSKAALRPNRKKAPRRRRAGRGS